MLKTRDMHVVSIINLKIERLSVLPFLGKSVISDGLRLFGRRSFFLEGNDHIADQYNVGCDDSSDGRICRVAYPCQLNHSPRRLMGMMPLLTWPERFECSKVSPNGYDSH